VVLRVSEPEQVKRVRSWASEHDLPLTHTILLVSAPVVVAFAFASYSGGLLPWLDRHSVLPWFSVIGIATTAFAAAYAANEAPPPVVADDRRPPVLRQLGGARVLAIALLCLCVLMLKTLGGFLGSIHTARIATAATWWGVPLSLFFWVLAALTIARETEQAGTGVPAAPARQWHWLIRIRAVPLVRRASYVLLFVGTLTFVVAGSIPGRIWTATSGAVSWQGHIYEPVTAWYVAFFVWGAALAITAWVYLEHAFRARPGGVPYAELRRAWCSVWAAGAITVGMALFVLSTRGWLCEPIVELAIGLYSLAFVLVIADAAATIRHRRIKTSFARRTFGALGTILFAVALPLVLGLSPVRAGLLAAFVAAIIPLTPTILRSLYGIERMPSAVRLRRVGDDEDLLEPLLEDPQQQRLLVELLAKRPERA
jgi:hypothetical protein